MYCKGITLKGGKCKKKCAKGCKYCYCHKGGNKYVPPHLRKNILKKSSIKKPSLSASVRRTRKPKKTSPVLAFKRPSPKKVSAKKKSPPKKGYVPPHLRKNAKKGRFIKMSPPKNVCVNYQHACKNTKYGNVYEKKCHPRNYIDNNVGLKNQAEKCVDLRKENRKCRINSGQMATPKHDHAIKVIEDNAYYCGLIIDDQVYPNKRRKSFKTPAKAQTRGRRR